MAMVVANHPALPPGVYFSPTREESMDYLNRWIAGEEMPGARGFIFQDDVYGTSPDVLRRGYPPGNTRGGDHKWWFLGESRFHSACSAAGAKRADRRVATGGYWRLEQSKQELPGAAGVRNSFGFYLGPSKKDKTAWLMEEYTSAHEDGTGKGGVPALHKLYVTPRATDDELRDIYGEDGVPVGPDGVKKPARAVVPTEYFDAVAALLPPGSVRGVVHEQRALAEAPLPPPPPPAPAGLVEHYCLQGQFLEAAPPAADVLGHYTGQFLDDHDLSMTLDEFEAIFDEQQGDTGDEFHAILDEKQGDAGDEFHAILDEKQGDAGDEFHAILDEKQGHAGDEFHAIVDEEQGHDGGELGLSDLGMPMWDSLEDICVIDDFLNLKDDCVEFHLD